MYYVYTFEPIPDSKNVTVACTHAAFKTLDKAQKFLYKNGTGYVTKYPSTKPLFTNAIK